MIIAREYPVSDAKIGVEIGEGVFELAKVRASDKGNKLVAEIVFRFCLVLMFAHVDTRWHFVDHLVCNVLENEVLWST